MNESKRTRAGAPDEALAGIQRLHTRLRSIIDAMRQVVISFSYRETGGTLSGADFSFYDEHLVEINPAAEALYGVPKEDFLERRRSIFDFLFEKDREIVLSHYNNLLEEGIGELTYRVVGHRDEIRWVLDYGRVEYLEGGRARRVTHILEDITKEKEALDELKASEEKYRRIFELSKDVNMTEAMRQKELESIGRLAGCFADDLASPLSVILMGSSATGDFLAGIRRDLKRLSDPEELKNLGGIVSAILQKLSEAEFFSLEAVKAVKDMKERLEEIREEYWKLKKVPDGAGGLIYERERRGKKTS